MEQKEQKALLSDFLYIDRERIASFYAQIFGGDLLSIEKEISDIQKKGSGISGGIPQIVDAKAESINQVEEAKKEIINPHDVKVRDVITKFLELAETGRTPIRIYEGSLIFMDNHLIKIMTKTLSVAGKFPTLLNLQMNKKEKQEFQEIIKIMNDFFGTIPLLPAFFLKTNNEEIVGTIKEEFLSEPISSFYLKHGGKWLKDVLVIGIEENTTEEELPETHLYGALKELLPAMSSMVFPPDSIKVVPIAIFRRVGIIEID